jgi:hypothetical protein
MDTVVATELDQPDDDFAAAAFAPWRGRWRARSERLGEGRKTVET